LPAPASLSIQHFTIQGNSALTAEEIDRVLAPTTGDQVAPEQLRSALRELGALYRSRGFSNAIVQAPAQWVSQGRITVQVIEGNPPPSLALPTPPAAPPAEATFEVRRFVVSGNTLLPDEQIQESLSSAIGTNVTLPRIQKALGDLQLAYRERGWASVFVSLPQQQLADATVQVQVSEGVLTDIQVTGNRHYATRNVLRSLPSLRTNTIPNGLVFQRELDAANQNRDRQIYPVLGPGPEPGTSALTLRVKDRFPLHGRIDVNNQATPATPEWRVNVSAQYNNLWQRDHQLGVSYGFSPEAFKQPPPDSDYLFNRPLIAFYGAYYRMPFGDPVSVEEQIRGSRAFGFDEATRQFRLPPASGRPEFSLYANAASSDTGIQLTPDVVVAQTPLLTIVSRDSGRNLTAIETAGARFSLPIALSETRRLNLSAGIEARRFALSTFNTNNFIITTVVTNAQGSQTIRSEVASPQPSRSNEAVYLPLVASIDFSSTDSTGSTSASLGLSGNFIGDDDDFAALAYSPEASATFGKVTVNFSRTQQLPHGLSALVRASGQLATGPLIGNEQFALGGMGTVRGYYEGQEVADAGWYAGVDLRTPLYQTQLPGWNDPLPTWLRGLIFFDAGQRLQLDGVAPVDTRTLWSLGFGASANLNNTFDLKVTVGWPLSDSADRTAYTPRANLSIGGQF
jgi:hemolysin activation/secretion protein